MKKLLNIALIIAFLVSFSGCYSLDIVRMDASRAFNKVEGWEYARAESFINGKNVQVDKFLKAFDLW
ncbi:MAG: hypothetical protein LBC56_01030 [Oscillospiraceae bacterium]|jgi:hypothetical protein|nr:hypothetical protein [Oscillospiraceae bacterium]